MTRGAMAPVLVICPKLEEVTSVLGPPTLALPGWLASRETPGCGQVIVDGIVEVGNMAGRRTCDRGFIEDPSAVESVRAPWNTS